MKRKILNIIIIIIMLFLLYQIIEKKSLVFDSINYSLNIWIKNLVPTLFPFFVISDILIHYRFTDYIPMFFKRICKYLFNITDNMITILLLSIISGFPSNARNTRTLYDNGDIDLDEANHILIFSHFSNPLFILTTVAIFFFNNEKIGVVLLFSHYLSNFLLGIFFRSYFKHDNNMLKKDKNNKLFIGNILILAIKRSVDTILLICGIVTIFLLLSSIINNVFSFSLYNSMLVKGIFEITIGIEALSCLGISLTYKAVIASCFLAFGGLSVHMQVMSQLVDTKISYKFFFIGRLYQTILSGTITYIICLFIF